MSAYCSQSDIEGEIQDSDLISLTDDSQTGNLNSTVLNQAIANASGEIDRYVGNIYQVPFQPAPPSVQSMAIVITCYRLYRRREVPDERNKYYEDYKGVRDYLKRVQNREDVLDLSAQQDFPQVQSDGRPTIYGIGNQLSNSM
ncbi:MAG: DUF1320 domain-containing protein [Patescibacteria group bacterium]|nr:DUF1320 domain-containing protein [Patescibacteria group bacterium]